MLMFLYGDDGLPMVRIVTKKQCSEGGSRAAPLSGVIWISGMFGDSDCDSHCLFVWWRYVVSQWIVRRVLVQASRKCPLVRLGSIGARF